MDANHRLIEYYLPPQDGFVLESLVATTYQVDFEFLEEDLLARALGVRAPLSRMPAFRSELERRLQKTLVTIIYDQAGCEQLARTSPRIDAIPVSDRKLHAKVTVQLWTRPLSEEEGAPDRRIRLVVGSANLTRQGFRENYECVAAFDFGGRSTVPRHLLTTALALIRDVGGGANNLQLARQLEQLEREAAKLPEGEPRDDIPLQFVRAHEVVPALLTLWREMSGGESLELKIVSPFWPEGSTAAAPLIHLIQQFGAPRRVELICRGIAADGGKSWLPEFDPNIAHQLREGWNGRLFLRAALPSFGTSSEPTDEGDESEDLALGTRLKRTAAKELDNQRQLHAKMIWLSAPSGSLLYVGSSNCTRRGLGLGGQTNVEAGLIYRLGPRQRQVVNGLFGFAGPPSEVLPDIPVAAVPSMPEPPRAVPTFLESVAINGMTITIRFRADTTLEVGLRITMADLTAGTIERFWLLFQSQAGEYLPETVVTDLRRCPWCDVEGNIIQRDDSVRIVPHIQVEVMWGEHRASFPTRFDAKSDLPIILLGRKPSEGELIDYFLLGKEPSDEFPSEGDPAANMTDSATETVVDTRRILSYFIRRFVEALPGLEAEILRSAYSRTALEATLSGPTSPLALARHAVASLTRIACHDEPTKTPTAVGFQLVEIIAALLRCRSMMPDDELRDAFLPVLAQCNGMLDQLVNEYDVLRDAGFECYRQAIAEDVL
jgi:hypothetical protein